MLPNAVDKTEERGMDFSPPSQHNMRQLEYLLEVALMDDEKEHYDEAERIYSAAVELAIRMVSRDINCVLCHTVVEGDPPSFLCPFLSLSLFLLPTLTSSLILWPFLSVSS